MTSGVTDTVQETSAPIEGEVVEKDTAPKFWAVHPVRGRDIHFNAPNTEQLMVLRRLSRQLDDKDMTPQRQLITLAKILDAVSACMADDDERDYVDQLVLDRTIGIEELGPLVRTCLAGPNADKIAPTAKKRVRRR